MIVAEFRNELAHEMQKEEVAGEVQAMAGSARNMIGNGVQNLVVSTFLIAFGFSSPPSVFPQIGGHSAADGTFVLDDVEDLDLVADGVGRDWLPDYIWPVGDVLSPLAISGSGLTPAGGQTPVGAFRTTIPEKHRFGSLQGYISGGFGVPVPGVAGASTLDFPGDITSFDTINFYACFEPTLPDQRFQVVLETYPGPDYPKVRWSFVPTAGTTFQKVEIDVWNPTAIEGGGSLTLSDLLSQTRFLYFYCYAGPVPFFTELDFHIDDIHLDGVPPAQSGKLWSLYE